MSSASNTLGSITEVPFDEELESSFSSYAAYLTTSRALPRLEDGLKPVQRRILYFMNKHQLYGLEKSTKVAKVVGPVMGDLHPHGDASIEDALVNLARYWKMSERLIHPQGNFGSPFSAEDGAAAARYIECSLEPIVHALMEGINKDAVDFTPVYDESSTEPVILPALYPNLLVNGATGIAAGFACSFAPHNSVEAARAVQAVLDDPDIDLDGLLKVMPGPDLPMGGLVVSDENLRTAYETGRGAIKTVGQASVEPISAKKRGVVISKLPHQVTNEKFIAAVKDSKNDPDQFPEVNYIADETDGESGIRIVLGVKPGMDPQKVIDRLLGSNGSATAHLVANFPVNNTLLLKGSLRPEVLSLKRILEEFIAHRKTAVVRIAQFDRNTAEKRLHIVAGLLKAYDSLDEIISIIRSSKTDDTAKPKLKKTFKFSEAQVESILNMQLRRLASLELSVLKKEQQKLQATIADCKDIVGNPTRVVKIIRDQQEDFITKYGSPRKSVVVPPESVNTTPESAVADTADQTPTSALSAHWDSLNWMLDGTIVLGSLGTAGSPVRTSLPPAPIYHVVCEDGAHFELKANEIAASGHPVTDFVPATTPIAAIMADGGTDFVLVTRHGVVKRLHQGSFAKAAGLSCMSVSDDDAIIFGAALPEGETQLVLATSDNQVLKTPTDKIRAQQRQGSGVAGIKLGEGATVRAAGLHTDTSVLCIATNAGTVKVTPTGLYPSKGRATGGVKGTALKKTETTILVATILSAPPVTCWDSDLSTSTAVESAPKLTTSPQEVSVKSPAAFSQELPAPTVNSV